MTRCRKLRRDRTMHEVPKILNTISSRRMGSICACVKQEENEGSANQRTNVYNVWYL